LLIGLKEHLFAKRRQGDFTIYKFLGDGWILLFPENYPWNEIFILMESLCDEYLRLFEKEIKPVLTIEVTPLGITFGMDMGSVIKMEMNEEDEYIGSALNRAARLQAAVKDQSEDPHGRLLISKAAFHRIPEGTRDRYQHRERSIPLRNIQSGAKYKCHLMGVSRLGGGPRGVGVRLEERLDRASRQLANVKTDPERFYRLNEAAKTSFSVGNIEDAKRYAEELRRMLPNFKGDWNYGNAIHDSNLVLGRLALAEGRITDAKRHLIEAGQSPGSPQMNSFGPNMSLAKDLLEKGERDVVLEYFKLCRRFWRLHRGRLDTWSKEVEDGGVPSFGANLVY
jgi:tetratricopeptide (TPR) repeat protein